MKPGDNYLWMFYPRGYGTSDWVFCCREFVRVPRWFPKETTLSRLLARLNRAPEQGVRRCVQGV